MLCVHCTLYSLHFTARRIAICDMEAEYTRHRVGQRGQLSFLLLATECLYKILNLMILAHINYIKQQVQILS